MRLGWILKPLRLGWILKPLRLGWILKPPDPLKRGKPTGRKFYVGFSPLCASPFPPLEGVGGVWGQGDFTTRPYTQNPPKKATLKNEGRPFPALEWLRRTMTCLYKICPYASTPCSKRYSGAMSAPLAQNMVSSRPNWTNCCLFFKSAKAG